MKQHMERVFRAWYGARDTLNAASGSSSFSCGAAWARCGNLSCFQLLGDGASTEWLKSELPGQGHCINRNDRKLSATRSGLSAPCPSFAVDLHLFASTCL